MSRRLLVALASLAAGLGLVLWACSARAEDRAAPRFLGVYRCSAYCPCARCCGRWARHRRTASGIPARGALVAVDPRVLELGSRVHVQGVGPRLCADTGRAIKGKRLDVLMPTHAQARRFGVKWLGVWEVEEE